MNIGSITHTVETSVKQLKIKTENSGKKIASAAMAEMTQAPITNPGYYKLDLKELSSLAASDAYAKNAANINSESTKCVLKSAVKDNKNPICEIKKSSAQGLQTDRGNDNCLNTAHEIKNLQAKAQKTDLISKEKNCGKKVQNVQKTKSQNPNARIFADDTGVKFMKKDTRQYCKVFSCDDKSVTVIDDSGNKTNYATFQQFREDIGNYMPIESVSKKITNLMETNCEESENILKNASSDAAVPVFEKLEDIKKYLNINSVKQISKNELKAGKNKKYGVKTVSGNELKNSKYFSPDDDIQKAIILEDSAHNHIILGYDKDNHISVHIMDTAQKSIKETWKYYDTNQLSQYTCTDKISGIKYCENYEKKEPVKEISFVKLYRNLPSNKSSVYKIQNSEAIAKHLKNHFSTGGIFNANGSIYGGHGYEYYKELSDITKISQDGLKNIEKPEDGIVRYTVSKPITIRSANKDINTMADVIIDTKSGKPQTITFDYSFDDKKFHTTLESFEIDNASKAVTIKYNVKTTEALNASKQENSIAESEAKKMSEFEQLKKTIAPQRAYNAIDIKKLPQTGFFAQERQEYYFRTICDGETYYWLFPISGKTLFPVSTKDMPEKARKYFGLSAKPVQNAATVAI